MWVEPNLVLLSVTSLIFVALSISIEWTHTAGHYFIVIFVMWAWAIITALINKRLGYRTWIGLETIVAQVGLFVLDGLNDSSEFVRDDKRDLHPICFIRE